ncbi:TadE family protein [Terriglobus albidus]|uniref:TadE family protein n=1 Tax=Terriglobus albidus TaxID=1592106 RepID=UPI0021DF6204|nr:TadE family protein [Terriglobus albidus]
MRISAIRRLQADDGSALIEFIFIAFMFIIVLAGVVELGRMVLVYTTVANAARAGARYAIVHGGDRTGSGVDGPSGPGSPCTCTQITTVVKNFASAGLVNTANLTVTVNYPNGSNAAGKAVTVTVSYPYDPLIPYFSTILNRTMGSTSEGIITF